MGDMREIYDAMRNERKNKREECFYSRLEYAIKMFEDNNVDYELKNKQIGHFNLYNKNKVVMSFWSYTGKLYIQSTGFSRNVGIRRCIKIYKEFINGDKS